MSILVFRCCVNYVGSTFILCPTVYSFGELSCCEILHGIEHGEGGYEHLPLGQEAWCLGKAYGQYFRWPYALPTVIKVTDRRAEHP